MARSFLDPKQAPQRPEYHSPHVQSDYNRLLPPQKTVNAHPSNAIYAPGTGAGTGTAAKKIGWMNRDGSRSAVSGLGTPTGSLSQPMPRMQATGNAAYAQRQQNVMQAKADGTFAFKQQAFNQANPGLHLHDDGHIAAHPDAEKRLAAAAEGRSPGQQAGNDVPTDGKGGYMAPRQGPTATPARNSTAGQAESMRRAAGIAGPSSSARGEFQQGSAGTNALSDQYGKGSSTNEIGPRQVATFDGKPRDQFFADAAQRQGRPNAFSSPMMAGKSPAAPAATPVMASTPTPAAAPATSGALPPSVLTPASQPTYAPGSLEARAQSLGNAKQGLDNAAGAKAITDSSGAGPLVKPTPTWMAGGQPSPAATPSSNGNSAADIQALTNTLKQTIPSLSAPPSRPIVGASKSAMSAGAASMPKPQPLQQSEFDRNPVGTIASGVGKMAGAAFDAFKQVGEKAAEHIDKTYVNNEALNPPAAKPAAPTNQGFSSSYLNGILPSKAPAPQMAQATAPAPKAADAGDEEEGEQDQPDNETAEADPNDPTKKKPIGG